MHTPSFRELTRVILDENAAVLEGIDEEVCVTLLEQMRAAKRIFVLGEGRSGLVMRMLAVRLMHLGLQVYVVGETTTPGVQPGDLLLTCSGSGETDITCLLAEKAVSAGAYLVAITANRDSRLARLASLVLYLATPHKGDVTRIPSAQYGGSLFEQSALLLLEAIFLRAMLSWNADFASLWERHANLE
jgi:6-phospho-3-hexuloisomerase